jgi:hypothetical protein
MVPAFRWFKITNWGGGIRCSNKGDFSFVPYTHISLKLEWETTRGGTNGTDFKLGDSDEVYYLIREKKFVFESEAMKLGY